MDSPPATRYAAPNPAAKTGDAMTLPARPRLWRGVTSALARWPTLLVLVLGFAVICVMSPSMRVIESDPDEGINLAKASLLVRGIGPYGLVWNDQPPLFTVIMALVHVADPFDVQTSRMVVALFAAVMLASLFATARAQQGMAAAIATVLLLGLAPLFLRLSGAVMVGLPAIALAVVALCLLLRRRGGMGSVMLSGVVFAMALETKLFVFLLAPAVAFALVTQGPRRGRAVAVWALACLCTFLAIAALTRQPVLAGNVLPHFEAVGAQFSVPSSARMIYNFLLQHPAVLLAGALGFVRAVARRGPDRLTVAAALWSVTAFPLLALHSPFWYHHALMLLVPMCVLAGPVLGGVATRTAGAILQLEWRKIPPMAAPLAVAVLLSAHIMARPVINRIAEADSRVAARALAAFSRPGDLLVTDRPMLAFRAGLKVPPELAVWSRKRMKIGQLTEADILRVIWRDRPRQVLLQRFEVSDDLLARLSPDYLRTTWLAGGVHLVRRDAADGIAGGAADAAHRILDRIAAASAGTTFAPHYDSLGQPRGEGGIALAAGTVWLRPPGAAQDLGEALLNAYDATGDGAFLQAAVAIADRIVAVQHCDGGWPVQAIPAAGCEPGGVGHVSFDEGMAAGILHFLARLAEEGPIAQRAKYGAAVDAGLAFLVRSQNADGGWPIIPGAGDYNGFSALNDTITPAHIAVLIDLSDRAGDGRLLDAARRGLGFLLDRQLPSGAWAQQYGPDGRPAAARSFEPAAASSLETAYAIRALLLAHARFGDDRYLAAAVRAGNWLRASRLSKEYWARLYDLATNLPIYGDTDGRVYAHLSDISDERRRGYRWQEPFPEVADALAILDAVVAGGAGAGIARQAELDAVRVIGARLRADDRDDGTKAVDTEGLIAQLERALARQGGGHRLDR